MKWFLIVDLIYISLMSNSVKHLFTCFLVICILSLGTCIFKYFACLSVGLFVSLLFSCKISLHILNTHLYQIYNLQIFFSHSLCCLFIFLKVSSQAQRFYFWCIPIYFSLVACAFGVISKNLLYNPRSWRFPIMFSSLLLLPNPYKTKTK